MFSTSEEQQRRYWDGTPKYRTVDHPVVQIFGRQRLAYLERWLDLRSIDSALDVGCGDGFSTVFMAERIRRVWAIDRSASMLARHPARGVLARADFLQLPFADGAVDLVYCWEVLHHLPDPSRAVAEMARVSRQYVLIAEPNRANPAQCAFALARRDHRWVFRYSQAYMRSIVERAGLRVAHLASGGFILPNRMPTWMARPLRHLPYPCRIGISNWVLGEKINP